MIQDGRKEERSNVQRHPGWKPSPELSPGGGHGSSFSRTTSLSHRNEEASGTTLKVPIPKNCCHRRINDGGHVVQVWSTFPRRFSMLRLGGGAETSGGAVDPSWDQART